MILADSRTNSSWPSGRRPCIERVQALVARLDTDTPPTRAVFVYRVEHLRAKELAATLTGLFRRRGLPEPALPRPGAFPFPRRRPGHRRARRPPTSSGTSWLSTDEIRVVPDEATNTLLVTATPQVWAALQPVLQRLDRMPRRVLIEILVAEFTLDDSTQLGIEWSLRSEKGIQIGGERLSVGSGLDTGIPGLVPIPPTFFFVLANKDILTLLQAFSQANRVNVLSSPHVMASENKRAQIHVGSSVPILTSQQQPATGVAAAPQPTSVITTTVEYRDVGVILTVTPRVADNRFVALDIRQEVSAVAPSPTIATVQGQPVSVPSPAFNKRVAETSVVVGEQETLVLGGLIEERKTQVREGIPFLSRIPILGYLFGATRDGVVKTELVIMVTPRLVLDPGESRSLYEEFRRRAPELKREMDRPGAPTPPLAPPPPPPAPRSLRPRPRPRARRRPRRSPKPPPARLRATGRACGRRRSTSIIGPAMEARSVWRRLAGDVRCRPPGLARHARRLRPRPATSSRRALSGEECAPFGMRHCEPQAERLLGQARRQEEAGSFDLAIETYRDIARRYPTATWSGGCRRRAATIGRPPSGIAQNMCWGSRGPGPDAEHP